jgi:anti-anti-sigma factor
LTIELEGELDIATAPALEQLLSEVERDRWPTVVLDLRQLDFIDSSGIRALLTANDRIGRLGGRMAVRHVARPVRRTLAAIGVDSILDIAHEPVDARGPVT